MKSTGTRLQKFGFDILFRLVYPISICIYDISSDLAVLGRKVSDSGWDVELCMLCCTMTFTGFTMLHGLVLMFQSNVFVISCFVNDLKGV